MSSYKSCSRVSIPPNLFKVSIFLAVMDQQKTFTDLSAQIDRFWKNRGTLSHRIRGIFEAVGKEYIASALLERVEVHEGHDVHLYLYLKKDPNKDPAKVIHVQAYPGLSSDSELCYMARWMDGEILARIRAEGSCSIGNEHEAATTYVQQQTWVTPQSLLEGTLVKAITGIDGSMMVQTRSPENNDERPD